MQISTSGSQGPSPLALTPDKAFQALCRDAGEGRELNAVTYATCLGVLDRLARSLGEPDAEGVAAEAIESVYFAAAVRSGNVEHPQAFARRIVHNACIDRRRRRAARPETQLGAGAVGDDDELDPLATMPDPELGPVDGLIAREERAWLHDALAAEPDSARKILELTLDGWSDREIGEVVGMNPGAVQMQRQRLKQRLLECMLEQRWLERRRARAR